MLRYNKHLTPYARKLRKEMTNSETFLWSKIRLKQLAGVQFYRQRVIDKYIVDFYCPRAKMVIEVDGGQHYLEKTIEYDGNRDETLRKLGLTILRFNNNDVLSNIEGVIETILYKKKGYQIWQERQRYYRKEHESRIISV
jgi:very-short-patch-repair endonuclease